MSNSAVFFQSPGNRLYSMMQSTNLVDGIWIPGESRMGAAGADSMVGINNVPAEFYRLENGCHSAHGR